MRVAKLDSSIETRLTEVETLCEKLGIRISGSHVEIEDQLNNRKYYLMDIELANICARKRLKSQPNSVYLICGVK